jgi:hypothetical protein
MMQDVRGKEIKYKNVMPKAAFNNKEIFFTRKLDLNLRKKLVHCYIWSVALCGAESGTVLYVERSFVWC